MFKHGGCAVRLIQVGCLLLVSVASCADGGDDAPPGAPPPHVVMPALVRVGAGITTVGFTIGKLRRNVRIDDFTIMKHPVTLGDYSACVEAGVCKGLAEQACTSRQQETLGRVDVSSGSAPAVCVEPDDAIRYCKWLGGRLPTLSEWLFAARGSAVRRYPWGNGEPKCDQHIAGRNGTSVLASPCEARKFEIGHHGQGASPHGVEDILLAPGELIGTDPNAMIPACTAAMGKACVAYGLTPGAIDFVALVPTRAEREAVFGPDPAHAFRCLLEGT